MSLYSFLFWGLVLATALVAFRWGAMIGLIFFVFALMTGAVAISRLSPPKADITAGALFIPAEAGGKARNSDRTPIFSMR